MNTELIGMRCDECGSRETSFDERLGERICDDCGLVIVVEQFEETVRGYTVGDFGNARTGDKGHLGSFTDKKDFNCKNRSRPSYDSRCFRYRKSNYERYSTD